MMSTLRIVGVPLLALAAAFAGCGGGSSTSSSDGAFTARVLWQDAPVVASGDRATGANTCAITASPVAPAGFGTVLPRAVRTVRVVFTSSQRGYACCLALPVDDPSVATQRDLTITGVPPGGGQVTVAGFPTSVAPASGITLPCQTDFPAATACGDGLDSPSYRSPAIGVIALPGTLVDAGDIPVFAVPFVVSEGAAFQPPRGGTLDRTFQFTVVDAVGDIDNESPAISVRVGTTATDLPLATREPCADPSRRSEQMRCHTPEDLGLAGFVVTASGLDLPEGSATVSIDATDQQGCDSVVSFDFTVPPIVITPTPVAPATPTETPTPTPTPTSNCFGLGEVCGGTDTKFCCAGTTCAAVGGAPAVCVSPGPVTPTPCTTPGGVCHPVSDACCAGFTCQGLPEFESCQPATP